MSVSALDASPPDSLPGAGVSSTRLEEQKARLQLLRDQAREQYRVGAPALQVGTLICDSVERLMIDIFVEAISVLTDDERGCVEAHSALVAIGGTGRGDLAPYSDADFLFLYTRSCPPRLADCIAQAVRDCWDAGIKLSHSVRTPAEAASAARADLQFATALVEARRVWGDLRLVESLRARFQRRVIRRRYARFYFDCLASREAEKNHYGVTERQLEPDVKRASGGLRDIHLLRWIGYATYGTPDINLLRLHGALSREDADRLLAAHEFIMRVRVDLHYAAGKAQEVLSREEQLRLADLYAYTAAAGQRPVERFMQSYFRHTTAVAAIVERFVTRHRPRTWRSRVVHAMLSHRNGIFRVSGEVDVRPRDRKRVCSDVTQLLNLYELAGLYSIEPAFDLLEQIRLAVPALSAEITPAAAMSFLSILRMTGNVGALMRSMLSAGLLEMIVPEMTHARCLLQFNQYHSYTVDEHSLRAIEAAEKFFADPGPLGTAYRAIRHKEILHLALLLHDLGKGFERDHSEVGREIAQAVAARLQLSSIHSEMLVFLVHKHLQMSHLALRRDLSDPDLLVRFSRDVGSPETLRMLYVLTAADITAVGPGVWTSWKADLLTDLFERAMQILSGEPARFREAERLRQVVRELKPLVRGDFEAQPAVDFERQLQSLPLHYLLTLRPPQIAADLRDAAVVMRNDAPWLVRGECDTDRGTVEYRVITRDEVGSGLFSKITGTLSAKGLQILAANICTTADRIVIDRFRVVDADHSGPIPDFRLREVEAAVGEVLAGRRRVEDLLRKSRRFLQRGKAAPLMQEPTRVVIDNDSSEGFTIVDVFAHDHWGLLYAIARALFDLDLSVSLAKIDTHLDQVLDVFYVTDRDGNKLHDEDRLEAVRTTLRSRIEEFESSGLLAANGD